MKLLFVDEAFGERFHIIAGVLLEPKYYVYYTNLLKKELQQQDFQNHLSFPLHQLGQGFDLKSKRMVRTCLNHTETHWHRWIEAYLNFIKKAQGKIWIVIINKYRFKKKPTNNESLFYQQLALRHCFERVQFYLRRLKTHALCILDQNKKWEDSYYHLHETICTKGSYFKHGSKHSKKPYYYKMTRLCEMHCGNSKNSIGLQCADLIASITYQYLTRKKRDNLKPKWTTLLLSLLDQNPKLKKHLGYGLKYIT
jgi:hypothetical protein